MLDSGASSNIITKKVMDQLNLKISRPYHNVCAMDSREIDVVGIILSLPVSLSVYPDIQVTMDVIVIDVPDTWGMLLSRQWAATLGGSIQLDWTYATIPASEHSLVKLYREHEKKYHVEDPKKPNNEFVYHTNSVGNYAIYSNFMAPIKNKFKDEKVDEL